MSRKPVLSDHKKQGQKLIPPALQMRTPLTEVDWISQFVPELVWVALLEKAYGDARAAALGLELTEAATNASPADPKPWFGTMTSFGVLATDEWSSVRAELGKKGALVELVVAVEPLRNLYPANPLSNLAWMGPEPEPTAENMRTVSQVLADLFDRRSRVSTFAQAALVYFSFCLGKLYVAPGLVLADFPEIQNYPDTPRSLEVAASVRAFLNSMVAQGTAVSAEWSRYFWNKGVEISDCVLRSWDD